MSIAPRIRDGYYDDDGIWQRTKFCFVYCGPERCTCSEPVFGRQSPLVEEEYPEPDPNWKPNA